MNMNMHMNMNMNMRYEYEINISKVLHIRVNRSYLLKIRHHFDLISVFELIFVSKCYKARAFLAFLLYQGKSITSYHIKAVNSNDIFLFNKMQNLL